MIISQGEYGIKSGCWREEVAARTWGKVKVARGSELPEKSGKIINKGERADTWAYGMK